MSDDLSYMTGFGNEHATEALAGALPVGRNSPQRAPYGLYAELLSGTAFTAPRGDNRRTWFYRIRPSVQALSPMREMDLGHMRTSPTEDAITATVPLRWDPIPVPEPTLTARSDSARGSRWVGASKGLQVRPWPGEPLRAMPELAHRR